jgi:TPR repeat protein
MEGLMMGLFGLGKGKKTEAMLTPEELFQKGEELFFAGDYEKSLESFQNAAEQGHADAQFKCGLMYHAGQGTKIDKTEALYWYKKAAEQGHGDGCMSVAIFYRAGIVVDKDLNEALRWAEKAKEIVEENYDKLSSSENWVKLNSATELIELIHFNMQAEENNKNW